MKAKYIPAILVFLGLITLQLGIFSPLREVAILPWSIGLLLFITAVVIATIQYRRKSPQLTMKR